MGVGFVGFGQTSKKLWLFEKSGPSCFAEEKIATDKRILNLTYKYRERIRQFRKHQNQQITLAT